MTPHGLVKAALANGVEVKGRTFPLALEGQAMTVTVGAADLIEKVDYLVDSPVLGDVPIEVVYSDYRDFGGVKCPTHIIEKADGCAPPRRDSGERRARAAAHRREAGRPWRLAPRRQQLRQHAHRIQGLPADVRGADRRSTVDRGQRVGAPHRARQADQIAGEHAHPLRSCRWRARVRGRRDHDHHPRDEPVLLREDLGASAHGEAGSALAEPAHAALGDDDRPEDRHRWDADAGTLQTRW